MLDLLEKRDNISSGAAAITKLLCEHVVNLDKMNDNCGTKNACANVHHDWSTKDHGSIKTFPILSKSTQSNSRNPWSFVVSPASRVSGVLHWHVCIHPLQTKYFLTIIIFKIKLLRGWILMWLLGIHSWLGDIPLE